jgi:hypothetical protein
MISALYDEVIYKSINRVAADTINDHNLKNDNSECSELNTISVVLIFVSSILLSILINMFFYLYVYTDVLRYRKYNAVGGNTNSSSNNREPLISYDMVDNND